MVGDTATVEPNSKGSTVMTEGIFRANRHPIALVVAPFILAACSAQQPTPTPTTCIVPHQSGFIGAGSGQVQMTMVQNGKPCEVFIMNSKGAVGVGKIVTPATHGTASLRFTYEATSLSYAPAHDYVGSDRFVVAFGSDFTETVDIQVVPSKSKP